MPVSEDQPTRVLIARAAQSDRAALEALLVQHLPGVEAYLRLRMGPLLRAKESASDLVQSLCRNQHHRQVGPRGLHTRRHGHGLLEKLGRECNITFLPGCDT